MSNRLDLVPLVEAARHGDTVAIGRLLAAVQPDIRRYARLTCRQSSDADDAVQETMWLVARRVSTLRLAASFSAWIFAVIRRECLRIARRLPFHDASLDGLENDLSLSLREDTNLRLDLGRAIGSLPAHYRRVIILRDIEELRIGEIATIENVSREAIKARLHRARSLVREYLEEGRRRS